MTTVPKMKIAYIMDSFAEFTSGCFQVRVNEPYTELIKRGHTVEYFIRGQYEYPELNKYDIVVFSRYYSSDVFRGLWKAKLDGRKIVYDLDDDVWNIPPANPAHEAYEKGKKHDISGMCIEADLVTVSTQALKELVEKETGQKNIKVIENGINTERFVERPHGEGLRIGWTGGGNHFEDIDIILQVITDLQKEYDFQFIIQGLTGNPWDADAYVTNLKLTRGVVEGADEIFHKKKMDVFKAFRVIKNFKHVPFYPPMMYPEILRSMDMDIGLIPIVGHKFDESKSIIKYLEYTATGTAVIASDREPYKCVEKRTDNKYRKWYNAIEELIKDKKLREDLVARAKKDLFPKYNIKSMADNLEKTYSSLL